jgi:hypothetical protein
VKQFNLTEENFSYGRDDIAALLETLPEGYDRAEGLREILEYMDDLTPVEIDKIIGDLGSY